MQGFYFSRPLAADDAARILAMPPRLPLLRAALSSRGEPVVLPEERKSTIAPDAGLPAITRAMIEHIPAGLMAFRHDGQILVTNRMADELFGTGDDYPLSGCFAAQRLPATMAAHIEDCLRRGATSRGSTFIETIGRVNFQCCPVDDCASSSSALLLVSPCKCDLI